MLKIKFTIFVCLYIGYFLYVFNRRSFTYVIHSIIEKDGLTNDYIGVIISSLAIAYAIGKFVGGILVDNFSPCLLFAIGLCGCGIINLVFSTVAPFWFPFLWFANGLFQGPGWPSCAKILQRCYHRHVFGTLWSLLSTSMNVSASVGPVLCSIYLSTSNSSWRFVMMICGSVSCGYALVSLFILKDKPDEIGLTSEVLHESNDKNQSISYLNKASSKNKTAIKEFNLNKKAENLNALDINVNQEISNKHQTSKWLRILISQYTYVISIGFFVCLLTKGVVTDWGPIYLVQVKGVDQYIAGLFVAWLEIGGIAGTIFSGYSTDKLVSTVQISSKGNPRHYVYIFQFVIMSACLATMRNQSNIPINHSILHFFGFVIGFCVYGNLSLSGILAIESAAKDLAGTAHACCALIGNIGLISSGFPFSQLIGYLGWNFSFFVLQVVVFSTAVLFAFSQYVHCQIGF